MVTQEEGIDYDEVFAPVARIEAIRLFLAYASFKGFVVYQMDVKSAFIYGKIEKEVCVSQPPGFEDPNFPDKVYKVQQKSDVIFISQDKYVADILKKFDFANVKTANSDYAGASLDKKSIIGGCQFLGKRLISWQCKKQTIVANSTTKADKLEKTSRIDYEVVQDQRQRDDNDLQNERQNQPKEEEVKPKIRKRATIEKSFGPDLFLLW
ncbi:copia protein [Tanacetum coccineum]|uniref:Copia protein n=1 Tax=Tanacetum coccineum TaxID=301880 RepID=A0ABQ5G2Q1_9ASTR